MSYDSIIIGGGHNGLVTAAYLAKAGQKVLLLEARPVLGGAAATEEAIPGYRINTGALNAGLFLPKIVDELALAEHGLTFIEPAAAAFAPQVDGPALTLWRDLAKTVSEVSSFSENDAARLASFQAENLRIAEILSTIATLRPPDIKQSGLRDLAPWLSTALKVKRLGKKEMMEVLRVLPMSVAERLDDWYENDLLKGMLAGSGITGSMQGPLAAGTSLVMLMQYCGAANGIFPALRFVKGGIGRLSEALAKAAQAAGAEIRTDTVVNKIIVKDYKAVAVRLDGAEEIPAARIISNADPRRTFFELVGPRELGPQFNRRVKNIRYSGTTARLTIVCDKIPAFNGWDGDPQRLSGQIVLAPSIEYLEKAYDAAKYGRFSENPYLKITIPTISDPELAPDGRHILSVTMQYAPFNLRDSDWAQQRDALEKTIIKTIAAVAPDIADRICETDLITPADWQSEYFLTEGSIFHGQMALDQFLLMRPVAGYGNYATPVENLYLCGAGTHPGGGVTGAPGYNAAREILRKS